MFLFLSFGMQQMQQGEGVSILYSEQINVFVSCSSILCPKKAKILTQFDFCVE